jgi:putative membrane-bound dehydrogenase-like protein
MQKRTEQTGSGWQFDMQLAFGRLNNNCHRSFIAAILLAFGSIVGPILADDFPPPTNTEKSQTKPMSPDEVCRTASLPPGFELTTFASEPKVQNPIAITTDDRGRLWIAENYTWAGADSGDFDVHLRDRVVILEDTDGDGKADKRKVFFDQAKRLTSVQVGLGGAWLLCPPQLLFVPDKNRDDIPDGPPQVVLDGFDLSSSTHTVANGLKWGPDGWLYGRQGILGTSKIGVPGSDNAHRARMNTGVWRYQPTQHAVEVVMHGMTNPWGFDYDAFGECFVTNTVIGHLWHVIPGARTERMAGSDFNPYAYQLISQTADHVHWDSKEHWQDVRKGVTDRTSAAGGGHAHTGLLIYQGDNWPDQYQNRAYTINLHGRRLNCDIFARTTGDYVAHHGPDMCFIADPWFRGMDLISGDDGGVFIADWSDTGECHEIGGVHRTSGRIYKLVYKKARERSHIDVAAASDAELVAMQARTNDWYSRRARLNLQERAAARNLDVSSCREHLLKLFGKNSDPVVRVRALWALYLTGSVDDAWLARQLHDRNEHIRVWAVRFLTDESKRQNSNYWRPIIDEIKSLAEKDQSGLVLLYIASAMQQMPGDDRWMLAEAFARRRDNSLSENRTLSIMLWLGIEPEIPRRHDRSLELLQRTNIALLRENISHRLASEIDRDLSTVEQLLSIADANHNLRADILKGIAAALKGRTQTPIPANWSSLRAKFASTADTGGADSLNIIGIAFQDADTIAALQQTVENSRTEPQHRLRALNLLLTAHPHNLNKLLRRLIGEPTLSLIAIRGLAAYNDADAAELILSAYSQLSPEQRIAAISTLSSRESYAERLIDALERKRLPTSDISAVQARQLMALGNPALSRRFQAVWGNARQSSNDKRQLIGKLRSTLTPTLAESNLQNGKALFTKQCATCHTLFGQGAKIGPDLTGSNRKDLDYLLENVVDPSAIVPAAFRANVIVLADGHVLTGIIREQNEKTITIETPDGKQVVDREAIEDMKASDKSLMPDGLLQPLAPSQIRDLIAYLMSNG